MSLGLLTTVLLLQTAYQLEDNSLKLTAARDRVSDLFVFCLHKLHHTRQQTLPTDRSDNAFAIVRAPELVSSLDSATVSFCESKWNNWMLAAVALAGLVLGFSMSQSPTTTMSQSPTTTVPSPSLAFDTERFSQTFKEARVLRERGTCRLVVARHELDGQQYLVQECLLPSAETLQASVKQSCEGADVLRYITCWIEQGPASSIRLFSQFAISH